MKKLFIFFLVFSLVPQLISANSDPGIIKHPMVKIDQSDLGNQFIVQLANLQQYNTSITLSDQDGNTLHTKKITKANGRRLQYTLKGFEDGNYQIIIEWNEQKSIWTLSKKRNQIEFIQTSDTQKDIWVSNS